MPHTASEEGSPVVEVVAADTSKEVILREPVAENDYLARLRIRERKWAYDAAFGPTSTQAQIYAATAAPLVEAVFAGAANATCFCYGATGAGKTHTMLGSPEQPGVMVRALGDLFDRLQNEPGSKVRLAYLEIYNENVRDLLAGEGPCVGCGDDQSAPVVPIGSSLDLREDPQLGVTVTGLTWLEAQSSSQVMSLLQRGNARRVTEPTRCNATSSRSHAVLQVLVTRSGAFGHTAKLSLIDLAGSERALATDARTARSAEGAAINKSLLALSSCIHALVEGKRHVPYRNSKLTQLLKDSLGGGCRTAMIANVSPAAASWNESQNTLHWADRAKEIRTTPAQTVPPPGAAGDNAAPGAVDAASEAAMAALRSECDALRARLEAQQRTAGTEEEEAVEPPPELQRTRSRRRMADGSAVPGGMPAANVAPSPLLSPVPASPVGHVRPPFITASAPNVIVPPSSSGATPHHGGPSRAAMAAEIDTLRSQLATIGAQKAAAEAAAADAEAAAAAARDAWAASAMEWDRERAAQIEALRRAQDETERLRRELVWVTEQQQQQQQLAQDEDEEEVMPLPCAELTNHVGRLSLPADGDENAGPGAAPDSVVKTRVRTFEKLASPAPGQQRHVPVPPSPGRIPAHWVRR